MFPPCKTEDKCTCAFNVKSNQEKALCFNKEDRSTNGLFRRLKIKRFNKFFVCKVKELEIILLYGKNTE